MSTASIDTVAGKQRFIREMLQSIGDDMLERAKEMPDEWDGHELRVYIADCFEAAAAHSLLRAKTPAGRRRRRDYQNVINTTIL